MLERGFQLIGRMNPQEVLLGVTPVFFFPNWGYLQVQFQGLPTESDDSRLELRQNLLRCITAPFSCKVKLAVLKFYKVDSNDKVPSSP